MKKNTVAIIACFAALALTGGSYAALMLIGDKPSESSVASVEESSEIYVPVSLFDFEKTDIKSVRVKNSKGEYVAVPDGEPSEDGMVSLAIEELKGMEINETNMSALLNSSAAVSTQSTAEENPADLSKYGLAKPLAEVTVKGKSAEKTLLIGTESPVKGETYCMEKGVNTVYTAPTGTLSSFFNSKEDYVSLKLLEDPGKENRPKIEEVRIKRTDLDYDMIFEYDSSADEGKTSGTLATHYMTKPVFAYLDSEKSQTPVNGFFGLSADSVMTVHPSEDVVAASGLDKPFCTVTMKTDEPAEYVLKIGSKLDSEDGGYYLAMFGDNDAIYAISPDNLCWASIKPDDVISRMVFGTLVWDIGKLDISTDGKTVSFKGSGTSADDYKVTKDGKECDTERFRSFYTFLLKTSAEEFAIDEKPSGEPLVSISLETQDGKTSKTVAFYKSDGKKALICVDGVPSFRCRMAYVDLLKDNLDKFDSSEEFVMNW